MRAEVTGRWPSDPSALAAAKARMAEQASARAAQRSGITLAEYRERCARPPRRKNIEISHEAPIPKGDHVYLVRGVDCIKIGKARDVRRRLVTLQACSPVTLTLLVTYPGYTWLEGLMHDACQEWRLHGEWFQHSDRLLATCARVYATTYRGEL